MSVLPVQACPAGQPLGHLFYTQHLIAASPAILECPCCYHFHVLDEEREGTLAQSYAAGTREPKLVPQSSASQCTRALCVGFAYPQLIWLSHGGFAPFPWRRARVLRAGGSQDWNPVPCPRLRVLKGIPCFSPTTCPHCTHWAGLCWVPQH